MEVSTKEQICLAIEAFKTKHGGEYSEYYIGITNNPVRRLIEGSEIIEHVNSGKLDSDIFHISNTGKNSIAVEIELEFQEKGMKGHNPESKGVEESIYVYCFKEAKKKADDASQKLIRAIVRKNLQRLYEQSKANSKSKESLKYIKLFEEFKDKEQGD